MVVRKLVITDVFTKCTPALVTRNKNAETVVRFIMHKWFEPYGIPLRVHSDIGQNSESAVIDWLRHLNA